MKGALVIAVLAASAAPALADEATDLFKEGRELAAKGDYVAACDRFEHALKIDPTALGTELNLADCYEHRAQTSRAWHMFDSIAAKAKAANDPSKVGYARDRADKLVVQLVTVRLHVAAPIPDGLAITVNTTPVATAAEIKDYADPGTIVVEAKAPKVPPFRAERRVGAGTTVDVDIVFRAPQKQLELHTDPTGPDAGTIHFTRKKSYRTTALVLTSAGAGAFIASGVLTLVAKWKHDGVLDDGSCHRTDVGLACNADGAARERSAGTFADAATIFAIGGGLLFVGGVTVFEIAPKIGTHDAGVVVTARF